MMHLANLITHRFVFAALFVGSAAWAACITPCVASADQPADAYQREVRPYIEKYCGACHGDETAKGDLNLLSTTSSRDVIATFRRWNHAIEFIRNGEMPPEDSPQPSIDESNAAVNAIRAILIAEAEKQAGDPGFVPPRRLSKTEYDLSIRDLTGIDIRPTRDFPPDPAAGEGFDKKATSTEAAQYFQAGYEAIVFGPGRSHGNSHSPNEFNTVEQLEKAVLFYEKIIEKTCL